MGHLPLRIEFSSALLYSNGVVGVMVFCGISSLRGNNSTPALYIVTVVVWLQSAVDSVLHLRIRLPATRLIAAAWAVAPYEDEPCSGDGLPR